VQIGSVFIIIIIKVVEHSSQSPMT